MTNLEKSLITEGLWLVVEKYKQGWLTGIYSYEIYASAKKFAEDYCMATAQQ